MDDAEDFGAEIVLILMRGLERGDLVGAELDARKDEDGAEEGSGDGAEGVESLRKIEAAFGGAGIAHFRDEGVGGGFKKREAAGDDEEGDEEIRVAIGERGGPEEQRAGAKEAEAGEDAGFVSRFASDKAGGDGEQEIAEIEGRLHESGLEAADGEGLHELADENVVEVVGNRPQEEECGNGEEDGEASGGNDARRILCGGGRDGAGGRGGQCESFERGKEAACGIGRYSTCGMRRVASGGRSATRMGDL